MQAPRLSRQPVQPFSVSLHIRHPALTPAEISRELRCEPDDAFGAGEPRKPRSGASAAGVHGETYWVATLDPRFWRGSHASADPALPEAAADPMESVRRTTHAALARLTPRESRVLRKRFGIHPDVEPGGEVAGEGSADRPLRVRRLIALGRQQGYLTDAQLKAHLPDVSRDPAQLRDVIRTLAELGIPVHEQESRAVAAIQRAGSFTLHTHLAAGAMQLSDALLLISSRLALQHAAFFRRVREEGGSARLLVTLSSQGVHGFSIRPELSSRLAQLGIHLELALAGGSGGRSKP
jgi:hypothetical protein